MNEINSEKIIEIKNLRCRYEGAESDALKGLDLSVERGEFLCVLGRNGSGKSTLGKTLNGLITPTEGSVLVCGISPDTDERAALVRRKCGMVFQNPDNQMVATIVEEEVAFGCENLGIPTLEIRQRVDEALELTGMSQFKLSAPHMLSGGQKQRIAIAGVIAMRPEIIVFDESTSMLDPAGRREVFNVARKLNKNEGVTVIWITHFMQEAASADSIAVIDEGRIVLEGTPHEVFSNAEELLKLGLEVPVAARLAIELRRAGMDISKNVITLDEMETELCRLL